MSDTSRPRARRPLPQDWPAEQRVLGALLSDGSRIAEIVGVLTAQFFHDPVHGRIFGAIQQCARARAAYLPLAVQAELRHGELDQVGGVTYLRLLAAGEHGEPLAPLAESIRDTWIRRRIIEVSARLSVMAAQAGSDAFDVPSSAQASASMFAWAIDAIRNTLPTAYAVSTALGLHDPDENGKFPNHVVALTDSEIEHLHETHARGAAAIQSGLHETEDHGSRRMYHVTRAAMFERLLPTGKAELALCARSQL